jgi:hypothetical protein
VLHGFLVGYSLERLTSSSTIGVASKTAKAMSILSQNTGELPNTIIIIEIAAPRGEVNSTRDRHIDVILDISLEPHSAFPIGN